MDALPPTPGPSPAPGPGAASRWPPREFVSPPTVADWLGIPVPVFYYEAAERGLLPAIRHGGRWRFHGPTVRRWLEEEDPAQLRQILLVPPTGPPLSVA
jgi:Helix-turn-helix domain